jgi:hypothetical protein
LLMEVCRKNYSINNCEMGERSKKVIKNTHSIDIFRFSYFRTIIIDSNHNT